MILPLKPKPEKLIRELLAGWSVYVDPKHVDDRCAFAYAPSHLEFPTGEMERIFPDGGFRRIGIHVYYLAVQ